MLRCTIRSWLELNERRLGETYIHHQHKRNNSNQKESMHMQNMSMCKSETRKSVLSSEGLVWVVYIWKNINKKNNHRKKGNTKSLTQISSSNTIVHPWTMMIHPTHTPITYSTMMWKGRLECLTLTTHGMTCCISPLCFHGYCRFRNCSRIRETCFCMRCKCHTN